MLIFFDSFDKYGWIKGKHNKIGSAHKLRLYVCGAVAYHASFHRIFNIVLVLRYAGYLITRIGKSGCVASANNTET